MPRLPNQTGKIMDQTSEVTSVQNEFGTVTNKRVVYFRNKGWLSGGSREDIPLQHVTSVRQDVSRSLGAGFLFLFIALGLFGAEGAAKIWALVFLVFAIIALWGSPLVIVNTAGRDLNAAKGWPWDRPKAHAFVEALRQQLFSNSQR